MLDLPWISKSCPAVICGIRYLYKESKEAINSLRKQTRQYLGLTLQKCKGFHTKYNIVSRKRFIQLRRSSVSSVGQQGCWKAMPILMWWESVREVRGTGLVEFYPKKRSRSKANQGENIKYLDSW